MTVVTIPITLDETGKWIAFGQSENSLGENLAVVSLLAAKPPFKQAGARFHTLTVTLPAEETADV